VKTAATPSGLNHAAGLRTSAYREEKAFGFERRRADLCPRGVSGTFRRGRRINAAPLADAGISTVSPPELSGDGLLQIHTSNLFNSVDVSAPSSFSPILEFTSAPPSFNCRGVLAVLLDAVAVIYALADSFPHADEETRGDRAVHIAGYIQSWS
jgi:hypothetical protein